MHYVEFVSGSLLTEEKSLVLLKLVGKFMYICDGFDI